MLFSVKTKYIVEDIVLKRFFFVAAKDKENALSEVLLAQKYQLELLEERFGDVNVEAEIDKIEVPVVEVPKGFL